MNYATLMMSFGTMGTRPTGLEEQERGAIKSRPTQPMVPLNKAHNPMSIIDKFCKIDK
jgi:hypothetical protein